MANKRFDISAFPQRYSRLPTVYAPDLPARLHRRKIHFSSKSEIDGGHQKLWGYVFANKRKSFSDYGTAKDKNFV